jgi:hypothetical protein
VRTPITVSESADEVEPVAAAAGDAEGGEPNGRYGLRRRRRRTRYGNGHEEGAAEGAEFAPESPEPAAE